MEIFYTTCIIGGEFENDAFFAVILNDELFADVFNFLLKK